MIKNKQIPKKKVYVKIKNTIDHTNKKLYNEYTEKR